MDKKTTNLFKDRFNKKKTSNGSDWFHDPSGEDLEFIEEKENEEKNGEI